MNAVLLIDDETRVLRALAHPLEAAGYRVLHLESAERADDVLRRERIDIVVLAAGAELPDEEALASGGGAAPAAIALLDAGAGEAAAEPPQGVDDFLVGPIDPRELLLRLRRTLERRPCPSALERLQRRFAEQTEELERVRRELEAESAFSREAEHRTKNDLASIAGFVALEGARGEGRSAPEAIASLKRRVQALQLVYERLYREGRERRLDFRGYLGALSAVLRRQMGVSAERVGFVLEIAETAPRVEVAVPLALITSELMTNALSHAFPGERKGSVEVRLTEGDAALSLTVADDGVGLPSGVSPTTGSSLGFRLVRMLAEQLGAHLDLRRDRGTSITLSLPGEGAS